MYNNKPSQNRAQACVDYLIKKRISTERIVAKGYGKQQLDLRITIDDLRITISVILNEVLSPSIRGNKTK